MDSFYFELCMNLKSFYDEMNVKKKKLFQHNHQPVRFIVKDCMYCRVFGNVLANNTSSNVLANASSNVLTNNTFSNSDRDSDLNRNLLDIRTTQDTITYSVHYKIFD